MPCARTQQVGWYQVRAGQVLCIRHVYVVHEEGQVLERLNRPHLQQQQAARDRQFNSSRSIAQAAALLGSCKGR